MKVNSTSFHESKSTSIEELVEVHLLPFASM